MQTFLTRRLGTALCMFGVVALAACDHEPDLPDVMVPERALLRALTPLEYNHTVADLLGFPWNGKAGLTSSDCRVTRPNDGRYCDYLWRSDLSTRGRGHFQPR